MCGFQPAGRQWLQSGCLAGHPIQGSLRILSMGSLFFNFASIGRHPMGAGSEFIPECEWHTVVHNDITFLCLVWRNERRPVYIDGTGHMRPCGEWWMPAGSTGGTLTNSIHSTQTISGLEGLSGAQLHH